jgi:dTMP kinase
LEAAGREVVYTREPGGTSTGEIIRDILQHDRAGEALHPETEVLLFAASRAQLVRQVIRPALERGACVVCDRFMDSTTAYQGYGRGFPVEQMLAINAFAVGVSVPHLTVLIDIDVSAGLRRISGPEGGRGGLDRIEREDMDFHEKVRRGYLALAERWPDRFHVLDGTRSVEEVEAAVWRIVADVLDG